MVSKNYILDCTTFSSKNNQFNVLCLARNQSPITKINSYHRCPSCYTYKDWSFVLKSLSPSNYQVPWHGFLTWKQEMETPNSTALVFASSRTETIPAQADLINTTDLINLSQTSEYSYKKWFVVQFKLINCWQMQLTLCKWVSWCSWMLTIMLDLNFCQL